MNRHEEARVHAEAVLRLHPDFSIRVWSDVQPDADEEVLGRFVEGLRRAGLPE